MAIPLQLQLFDSFLGTQEGIHSILLPDIFSSGGSSNVYIDKFARVSQILGYTPLNASPHTTSATSAAMIRGLISYRGTGGGTVNRKLLIAADDQVNEYEIWVSSDNGATKSLLEDFGASSINSVPDAAQFGDDLYLTNGVVQPRKYNGTVIATTGLTQSPQATAAESASSGNLVGNYVYKLVSTIAGVRQSGSLASTNLLVSNKQVDLSWTADANTDVDGYEIYRTTGVGSTYYYLTSIDGRTTVAYVDNISDPLLLENRVLEEHGDAPPIVHFCEPHKQRLWWLRTSANPTRGYWSDAGNPQSVYAQAYLDFSDSETVGDVITGALGNFEGLFVVFTEKAIWTVSGTGSIIGDIVDWTKTRTNATIGAVTHRAVARVPAGAKYSDTSGQIQTTDAASLAYFTPYGDIRLFDGENDLIISTPLHETIRDYNYASRSLIHCVIDAEHDQIIWFIPSADSGEPDIAAAWNYRYGVWYKWNTQHFGHSVMVDTSTDPHLILTGEALSATGAHVYDYFTGHEFGTTQEKINGTWMTKTLYGVNEQGQPALTHRKRWRWADLLFRVEQTATMEIEWLEGGVPDNAAAVGSLFNTPGAAQVFSIELSDILSASGSEIVVALATAQTKLILHTAFGNYLHDEGIRLRIRCSTSGVGWSLEGINLAYQILPGLKRRDQA